MWEQIAKDISKDSKVNITGSRAFNKYNSFKQRWKEVIESEKSTGSEPKYLRQRQEFDAFLGCKSSTRPKFVIDSNENDTAIGDNQEPQPERMRGKRRSPVNQTRENWKYWKQSKRITKNLVKQ